MFGSLGWPEILVIVLLILLLFGAKRIPEVMRSLRQGLDEFRNASMTAKDEINKAVNEATDETTNKPSG